MLLVLLIAAVTWFVTNDAQAMLAVRWCRLSLRLVLCPPRPRLSPGSP